MASAIAALGIGACNSTSSAISRPPAATRPFPALRRKWTGARQCRVRSSGPQQQEPGSSEERVVFLPSGHVVSLTSRQRKSETWPELMYSREEALQVQLAALQDNNTPHIDHGVEVLYRWADFDPFNPRTMYFGRLLDLGQFERFRRIMHTPPYVTLLGHESAHVTSTLEVSDRTWVARVAVAGPPRGERPGDEAVYEFTLVQRLGGVHDGYWYTSSLVADGNSWDFLRGPRIGQAV